MTFSEPILIAVGSSNVAVRDRVTENLRSDDSIDVVATTASRFALLRVAEELQPQVVIVDDSFDLFADQGLIEQVRHVSTCSNVLAFVRAGDRAGASRAVASGAGGVIAPDAPTAQLAEAIHAVASGYGWIGLPDTLDSMPRPEDDMTGAGFGQLFDLIAPHDESGTARVEHFLRRFWER